MSLRTKLASDLGNKNIPKAMVQSVAPSQLASLYWREEASSPAKTVVEIWMLANNSFIVVSGDISTGEWSQGGVSLAGEFKTLQEASASAKENFTFAPIEEDEVAKEQVETTTQQPAQEEAKQETTEEAPTENKTAGFKRLLKKN